MIKQLLFITLICATAFSQTDFTVLGDTYVDEINVCTNYGSAHELRMQDTRYGTLLKFDPSVTTVSGMTKAEITLKIDASVFGIVYIYTADDFDEMTANGHNVDTSRAPSAAIDSYTVSSGDTEIVLDITSAVAAGEHVFLVSSKYGGPTVQSREVSGGAAVITVYT